MYGFENPCVLEFGNVGTYADIHKVLRQGLDLPEYYGENWDALWDCLTDISGEEVFLEIAGYETLAGKFPEAADTLVQILREWKHYASDAYCDRTRIVILGKYGSEELR